MADAYETQITDGVEPTNKTTLPSIIVSETPAIADVPTTSGQPTALTLPLSTPTPALHALRT